MQIAGSGITSFTVKLKPDFTVLTSFAIRWVQSSANTWKYSDRGAAEDIYESDISIYGTETTINTFIDWIEANRTYPSNVLQLSGFTDTEHIFGENVNHGGTVNANIVKYEKTVQNSWKGFGLNIRIRALSPAFTGTTTFPALTNLQIGYDANSEFTLNSISSYNNTFTYQEHDCDTGTFTGTFTFTLTEIQGLRNYIRVNRGDQFILPAIAGIEYPFGKRRGLSFTYDNIYVRIKDYKEGAFFGLNSKYVTLTFTEV